MGQDRLNGLVILCTKKYWCRHNY